MSRCMPICCTLRGNVAEGSWAARPAVTLRTVPHCHAKCGLLALCYQVMALIADFMLVWLSAPRVMAAGAAPAHRSAISKFLAACPDNAFQAGSAAPPSQPFVDRG